MQMPIRRVNSRQLTIAGAILGFFLIVSVVVVMNAMRETNVSLEIRTPLYDKVGHTVEVKGIFNPNGVIGAFVETKYGVPVYLISRTGKVWVEPEFFSKLSGKPAKLVGKLQFHAQQSSSDHTNASLPNFFYMDAESSNVELLHGFFEDESDKTPIPQ